MKSVPVDIRHLEEAFGVDLKEFKEGKTYPLSQLMSKLNFAHPRLRRRRQPKENISEKETAEAGI